MFSAPGVLLSLGAALAGVARNSKLPTEVANAMAIRILVIIALVSLFVVDTARDLTFEDLTVMRIHRPASGASYLVSIICALFGGSRAIPATNHSPCEVVG